MVFVHLFFSMLLTAILTATAYAADTNCLTTDCHADLGETPYLHAPLAEGDCLYCHVRTQANHPDPGAEGFELIAGDGELCFLCHVEMNGEETHGPAADGDCLSCHQPHGSDNPFLLPTGGDRSPLCFECHDETPFTRPFHHGPVAVGACNTCHAAHASDHRALLKKPVRDMCLGCHDDFASKMENASFVHPPVRDAQCTDCHDPHTSEERFSLKQPMLELCFSCHPDIDEQAASAKVAHQPMTDQDSCGSCHSTHFSREHGLLSLPEQDLCLGCHGEDSSLSDIAAQISGDKTLHGPIEDGQCGACHNPHGSQHYRLLRASYPEGRYAPYQEGTYALCLECHEENLLRYVDTTLYTNFRNGDLNLHFVHVADPRKGRTCRLCHEPHASVGEKLINRQGMPFGNWKVPIGFEPTGTGGSCTPGCHQPLSYDREEPVENEFESFYDR